MNYSQSQSSYGNQPTSWTRADLILALYDRTVVTLRALSEAIMTDDVHVMKNQTSVIFLLEQIVEGVDTESCTYADEILRICEYAFRAANEKDVEAINASAAALEKVQEGFATIRSEAVAMENSGTIPPLHSPMEFEG